MTTICYRGELEEVQRLTADLVPGVKAKRIHREALAARLTGAAFGGAPEA